MALRPLTLCEAPEHDECFSMYRKFLYICLLFSFMREPTARKQQVSQKGMYHKTTAVDFYISLNPTLYTPRIFTVPAYTAEEERSTSVRPYQYQSRRCCHSPQQALVELNQMRSCKTRCPDRPQRTTTERLA